MSILADVAPTIATALAGPLAGVAVGFISKFFGVDQEKAQEAVAGADPVKLQELEEKFKEHLSDNGIKLQLAQIDVNKTEASSTSLFVSGWRPWCGWVGGAALAYSAILEPVARFVSHVGYGYNGAFPIIDTNITLQVLMGLLGLAGMRTYEKTQGVAAK